MADEHVIEIEIPPAWWWEQDAAARLEAQRRCPLDPSEVAMTVTRQGMWRPNAPGRFSARFAKLSFDASDRLEPPRNWLGAVKNADGVALVACVLVLAACALVAPHIHPTPPPPVADASVRGETQPQSFEPASALVRDLSIVASAMPDAEITSIRWSTAAIAIEGANLDMAAAQAAVRQVAPSRAVEQASASERAP